MIDIPRLPNQENFNAWAAEFQQTEAWRPLKYFGIGKAVYDKSGKLVDVEFFRANGFGKGRGAAAAFMHYFAVPPHGIRIIWPSTEDLCNLRGYFTAFTQDPPGSHPNVDALQEAGLYSSRSNHVGKGPVCFIFVFRRRDTETEEDLQLMQIEQKPVDDYLRDIIIAWTKAGTN